MDKIQRPSFFRGLIAADLEMITASEKHQSEILELFDMLESQRTETMPKNMSDQELNTRCKNAKRILKALPQNFTNTLKKEQHPNARTLNTAVDANGNT